MLREGIFYIVKFIILKFCGANPKSYKVKPINITPFILVLWCKKNVYSHFFICVFMINSPLTMVANFI